MLKILKRGGIIKVTCPVCGSYLSRAVRDEETELEITCAVCGSVLLWTRYEDTPLTKTSRDIERNND